MSSTKPSLFALLGAFALLGCHSDPYGSDPDTAYRIDAECSVLAPACDQEELEECTERGARACRLCYELGGLGCASQCEYGADCRRWHCNYESPGCAEYTFTATLGEQDPAIREACELANAHHSECGEPTPPQGSCELYAATDRAGSAAIYECFAASACSDYEGCDDTVPDVDLAQDVCSALADCEWSLPSCDNGNFAALFAWLRNDVKEGGRYCAELPSCEERRACLGTWLASVTPE